MQTENHTKTVIITVLVFLTISLAILSVWALMRYNVERSTVQEQIEIAEAAAKDQQREASEAEFAAELKNPYRTYKAPDVFGGIEIKFPKNWNVYVEDTTSGQVQIDLFIHPNLVRVQRGSELPRAFRLQLIDRLYEDATREYRRAVDNGRLEANAVTVSGISGVRYDGEINRHFSGRLVALPYRDKTILMWTESRNHISEFNKILEESTISR